MDSPIVSPSQPPIASVPDALMPVVHEKLNQLAEMPPGPATQAKVADILTLIVTMLNNPAISAIFPTDWKGWVAAATAALTIIAGSFTVGRVTAPVPPIVAPMQFGKPVSLVLHFTKTDPQTYNSPALQTLLAANGVKDSIDPKVYEVGSVYQYKGSAVTLPCVELIDSRGAVVDVVAYTTTDDLVKFVSKHLTK